MDFETRPGTFDRDIFRCVHELNEYRLPERMGPEDVVIDVGAHIGSFAYTCLARGAGRVICFEASRENFEICVGNLAPFGDRVEVHNVAVTRSDGAFERLAYTPSSDPANTGGGGVMGPVDRNDAVAVRAIGLDTVLRRLERCAFLKLDCEGSEFPILYTSAELRRVAALAGEFHTITDPKSLGPDLDVGRPYTAEALCDYLNALGLSVSFHHTSGGLGLFFACWDQMESAGAGTAGDSRSA